jgi:hypothetical protein
MIKFPMAITACLLIEAISSSANADDQSWQQFAGLYRPAGADGAEWVCKPDYLGQDGGALGIIDGVLYGLESSCELTNARAADDGAVQFTAVCEGEGEQYTDEVTIAAKSEGLSLSRNGASVDWVSCDAASATDASVNKTQFVDAPQAVLSEMEKLGILDVAAVIPLDLDDDGDLDLIAQGAFLNGDGAMMTHIRHFIFTNTDAQYSLTREIELGEGVISVTREGRSLDFVVWDYLDSDATCCPSGQRKVRVDY